MLPRDQNNAPMVQFGESNGSDKFVIGQEGIGLKSDTWIRLVTFFGLIKQYDYIR